MKAVIHVRSLEPVWIDEKVGEFEYTSENYRDKIAKLKELLGSAKLE